MQSKMKCLLLAILLSQVLYLNIQLCQDTQHNIPHNGTQNSDTQHNWLIGDTQYNIT